MTPFPKYSSNIQRIRAAQRIVNRVLMRTPTELLEAEELRQLSKLLHRRSVPVDVLEKVEAMEEYRP